MRRGVARAFTGLAAVAVAATALAASPDAEHGGHGDHGAHGASADLAPAPIGSESVYQLDARWRRADGAEVALSSLAGRVQVLAMVYTHCEHACPRIIADMRRLGKQLGDVADRVGYALVSIDPERDDPERLAAFARRTGLEGWTLLTGDEGSVRELAAALGVRYRRISDEDFLHSNLLSVLDPGGVVVHRQVGLGVDPKASAEAIRALLAEQDQR